MAAASRRPSRSITVQWIKKAVAGFLTLGALTFAQAVSQSATAEPFRIGASPTGILAWMAQDLGHFERNDVAVEVRQISSGVEALDMVQSGELDLGASSEFAFISRAISDPSLCIYATISASRTIRLMSRADRVGQKVADLRGKRIGVTFGAASRFFLWQFLTLAGIGEDELTLVNMRPAEITAAMVDGSIDSGIVWEPHVTNIRKSTPVELIEYPDQSEQHYYFTLQGKCDLETRKPDELRRVLRALVEAERSALDQASAAHKAFSKRFGVSEEEAAQIWGLHTLSVSLPQDLLFLMELEAKWRESSGLDSGANFDSLERIKTAPLADVAPGAVQIIR